MAAGRAVWKGVIVCGENSLPVKLYAAVEERGVHFRLLSRRHKTPVRQRMVDAATGEEVEKTRVQKGYEAEPGAFVLLAPSEIRLVQPKPSRQIEVVAFVPRVAVGHEWYERPYFLGPDGPRSVEARYFALVEALTVTERIGIARWVMRNIEYVGALTPHEGYLALISLRHAEEVVSASALHGPEGKDLDSKELAMARQLVGAMEGEFDPDWARDEYRERVLEMVERKARGLPVKSVRGERKATQPSLVKALQASLQHSKRASNA
jgi:DNA end-binding protein Ku